MRARIIVWTMLACLVLAASLQARPADVTLTVCVRDQIYGAETVPILAIGEGYGRFHKADEQGCVAFDGIAPGTDIWVHAYTFSGDLSTAVRVNADMRLTLVPRVWGWGR